jgi:hypothetical protein
MVIFRKYNYAGDFRRLDVREKSPSPAGRELAQ